MGLSIPGAGLIKDLGNKVVDGGKKVVDTGKKVVDTGKKVVDKGRDVAGGVVHDTVELSKDALKFRAETDLNFAKGVVEWGKDNFNTVKGIVTNPVATGKAVFNLATNPVLNPIGGLTRAAIEGKNPIEAYKDGGQQLKDIGSGIASDYKKVYDEHGVAGVAGYLAPDVALAVLSGGSSAGAKGAGTAAAKGIAKEVAEETVEHGVTRGVAREVAEQSTGKTVAKEIAKELAPGPEDVADNARKAEEQRRNERRFGFLNPFHGSFDLVF